MVHYIYKKTFVVVVAAAAVTTIPTKLSLNIHIIELVKKVK